MPYRQFEKIIDGEKRYCIKNIRTGKVTCYYSPGNRETGIRIKEAFAHGFKPTGKVGLAGASKKTRRRVARMGGRASRRR